MTRGLIIIGCAFALLAAAFVLAMFWSLRGLSDLGNWGASGQESGPRQVYPLEGLDWDSGTITAVLRVSDMPLAITETQVLLEAAEQVYYTHNPSIGAGLGSFALTMMGAPLSVPQIDIYRDGQRIAAHFCGWQYCNPDAPHPDYPSVFTSLSGQGVAADIRTETYQDYAAYRAAHQAALADPKVWINRPEALAEAPDGLTRLQLSLPEVLWQVSPRGLQTLRDEETEASALAAQLTQALDGLPVQIEDIRFHARVLPLITDASGARILSTHREGSYIALDEHAFITPTITLAAPQSAVAELRTRLSGLSNPVTPDIAPAEALTARLALDGITPDGHVFAQPPATGAPTIQQLQDPFWTLETVHLSE